MLTPAPGTAGGGRPTAGRRARLWAHALLTDDDEVVRRNIRQALEPTGWNVAEAENGQVAVEAITAARPDVIILDLMMPKARAHGVIDHRRRSSLAMTSLTFCPEQAA